MKIEGLTEKENKLRSRGLNKGWNNSTTWREEDDLLVIVQEIKI